MEQYFITLQTFTLEEYEVWKQLNKYCNFETGVAGYTVNKLLELFGIIIIFSCVNGLIH